MLNPNPLTRPETGAVVVVELDRALLRKLLNGLEEGDSARLMLEVDPDARASLDGTVDADLKASRNGGRWTAPLGAARVRLEELYAPPIRLTAEVRVTAELDRDEPPTFAQPQP